MCLTPSPSSSPSLAPIDSSPPSSPALPALRTPPASPAVRDPFAGSSKSTRRPPSYELHASPRHAIDDEDARDSPVDLPTRVAVDIPANPLDATPTRPTRAIDPFSASANKQWRPPAYEMKRGRVSTENTPSGVSIGSYTHANHITPVSPTPTPHRTLPTVPPDDMDDLNLTDDERDMISIPSLAKTREESEHELWDTEITRAIETGAGVIDLSSTASGIITHIPPAIADLESFTVLSPLHPPSNSPPSPTLSPRLLPAPALAPLSAYSTSRPFTRASTVAAVAFGETFFRSKDGERLRGTPAARAASLQALGQQQPPGQLRRKEISIYLANNAITQLPPELFRVSALTVLSLRGNNITSIPSQIVQLTGLRELNLTRNKIPYLPAEMLHMSIPKLTISGNPWISPPGNHVNQAGQRPVSDTIRHSSIPSLAEFCLRVLIAPCNTTTTLPVPLPKYTSVLEACYALPLTEDLAIGASVLATLRTCVPAAVARPAPGSLPSKVPRSDDRSDVHSRAAGTHTSSSSSRKGKQREREGDRDDVFVSPLHAGTAAAAAGISVCPSPVHRAEDGSWRGGRVPVYVRAAEERWTWEDVVAGVRVGTEGVGGGVGVPVHWRGCSRGCLAFLDPPTEASGEEKAGTRAEGGGPLLLPPVSLHVDLGGGDMAMDEDAELMRFDGGLADPEEFEDPF